MSRQSIHFRTRGGPSQGWGNVFRLTGFAEYCRERGHGTIRFFAEGPNDVIDFLRGRGFETVPLKEGTSVESEERILSAHASADVAIMEMLDCTLSRQDLLTRHTKLLAVFDDLLDHRYSADVVVCGQALPGYGNIDISSPTTTFLTGYDFFLLSPAFQRYSGRTRTYRKCPEMVLVALGGGRYDVGYIKAAQALSGLDHIRRSVFVLGYDANHRVRDEVHRLLPTAQILGGVENMHELLWQCDLAIVSGGYLKIEAAACGTPAVVLATQWHQIPLAEEFTRKTAMPFAGYMGFVSPGAIRREIQDLHAAEKRHALADEARRIIDGKGVERVYEAIFEGRRTRHRS